MSLTAPHSLWLPQPMRIAPALDANAIPGPLRRRYALLINPFYRKDPHASFGKHVLTPTLALTAVALRILPFLPRSLADGDVDSVAV